MSDYREYRELEEIERGEHSTYQAVLILASQFKSLSAKLDLLIQVLVPIAAVDFQFTQKGDSMGVVAGLHAGETIIIDVTTLPAGSLEQAGSQRTFTQDNTLDVSAVVPAVDGSSFAVTGAPSFSPGAVLNVTCAGTSLDGTAIKSTVNIPLLAATGVAATGFDFNQRPSATAAALRR